MTDERWDTFSTVPPPADKRTTALIIDFSFIRASPLPRWSKSPPASRAILRIAYRHRHLIERPPRSSHTSSATMARKRYSSTRRKDRRGAGRRAGNHRLQLRARLVASVGVNRGLAPEYKRRHNSPAEDNGPTPRPTRRPHKTTKTARAAAAT